MTHSVLLTGSTGAIGSLLHKRLIDDMCTVVTVGRQGDILWDLHDPIPDQLHEAVRQVDLVIHAAADIRLGGAWDELEPTNVAASAALAASVAGCSPPPRFLFVSSAYAPPRSGRHNNSYERSKWSAEQAVRASGVEPTIVRPSLVIGSRGSGHILRFSGIFQFIRMLSCGLVPAIPGKGGAQLDVVPVDAVIDVIASEIGQPSGDDVVHASSGVAAPTLEQMVDVLFDILPPDRPKPKFVSQDVYHRLFRPLIEPELSGAQMALLEMIEVYLPYFEQDYAFDSAITMDSATVLDTWRSTVVFWAETEGINTGRGEQIWARR